jgi:1-acyl-sn-glycerol-3-phosphate acyltransferase
VLYRFLWVALRPFVQWPFRMRFLGRSRVPARGGVILAPNHESYLDPVAVGLALRRSLNFMARDDLWRHPALGWLLDRLHTFPVKRGAADRGAIAEASRRLEAGEPVLIFPQGTRHHAKGLAGLEEGAGGTALIALRSGCPVVPVGIHGTERVLPQGARFIRFPRVTIAFGEPIDPADIPEGGRRERMDALTSRIMEGIAAAYAEAERGG